MRLGIIGLGKMGFPMAERLAKGGHEVFAYNRSREKTEKAEAKGIKGAFTIKELVESLGERKIVWLMVPAGETVDGMIRELLPLLSEGDIIVDGGNSYYKDSIARARFLAERKISFIDCGTSGGVWGLENGYCLMYGGDREAASYLEPLFKTLAQENGYLYCGKPGSGHFVKMVHNGIEYGMMQSYAEGFALLEKSDFSLDLAAVCSMWQNGSVVRSWLLDLAQRAFSEDPHLEKLEPYVDDSGEGRWTVNTAIELGVPAPAIAQSIFARFQSRGNSDFSMKTLSALRNQFGGHSIRRRDD